ncbi:MAG TPA: hypothetical protein VFM98_25860 [Ramlibacter sp.]|uniref:hypothetical protein n=1 Tax=Ramlibacter sp. TaxID=1917967 RepID=UPI002D7F1F56|nr:hypothetical protein [Ramlibacter sp.]HET8749045.1 hypothetical protein [Ramlibacter sp.]
MNTRAVLWAAAAIACAVVLAVAGVFLLLHFWKVAPESGPVQGQDAALAAQASLRSAPQPERVARRAEQERRLHGFGWVDARRGIAHIPIEQAMDLLVQGVRP